MTVFDVALHAVALALGGERPLSTAETLGSRSPVVPRSATRLAPRSGRVPQGLRRVRDTVGPMTVAPDAPILRFETLEEAIAAVRGNGLRLSTARRLILEALFAVEGPVAAPYLVEALSIDESSVYRNLEVLESHGLVRHVHLGHGPGLYVLLGGDEREWLYCERCAKVTAVDPARLEPVRDAVREEFGYEPRFTHFAIVGRCAECAAGSAPGPSPGGEAEPIVTDAHRHSHLAELEAVDPEPAHDHAHSHGDFVHSHPHPHTDHGHG